MQFERRQTRLAGQGSSGSRVAAPRRPARVDPGWPHCPHSPLRPPGPSFREIELANWNCPTTSWRVTWWRKARRLGWASNQRSLSGAFPLPHLPPNSGDSAQMLPPPEAGFCPVPSVPPSSVLCSLRRNRQRAWRGRRGGRRGRRGGWPPAAAPPPPPPTPHRPGTTAAERSPPSNGAFYPSSSLRLRQTGSAGSQSPGQGKGNLQTLHCPPINRSTTTHGVLDGGAIEGAGGEGALEQDAS